MNKKEPNKVPIGDKNDEIIKENVCPEFKSYDLLNKDGLTTASVTLNKPLSRLISEKWKTKKPDIY